MLTKAEARKLAKEFGVTIAEAKKLTEEEIAELRNGGREDPQPETPQEEPEPETPEETPEEPEETPQAEEEPDTPEEKSPLEQLIEAMPENTPEEKLEKEEALKQLTSLKSFQTKATERSKFAGLDKDLRDKDGGLEITEEMVGTKLNLPAYMAKLEGKHSTKLTGRKVSIAFPKEGDDKAPEITNVPKGTRAPSGGGRPGQKVFTNGEGQKESYDTISYIAPDGREEQHDSLNAFAGFHKIKYNGRPTGTIAVQDPLQLDKDASGNYPKFPYTHSITPVEKDGKKILQIKRVDRKN